MGQQVISVMWGVKASEVQRFKNDDYDWPWETGEKPRLDYKLSPRNAYEGDVLGYPVASGPASNGDEGELGSITCRLSEWAAMHGSHVAAAQEKWSWFAQWLKDNHGISLGEPDLWITYDERA